jgi:hypothetical protein
MAGTSPAMTSLGGGARELSASLSRFRTSTSLVRPKLEGNAMRLSILAGLMLAVMMLPAHAVQPVKGAVKGTANAATGVAKGTVQAGRGVARGTVTAARGVGRGARCMVTLGNRC